MMPFSLSSIKIKKEINLNIVVDKIDTLWSELVCEEGKKKEDNDEIITKITI